MTSKLKKVDLTNLRVFLRADLNVPFEGKEILDTFRLDALCPTLDLLITKNCRIILATHLGRPKGYDEALSTKNLLGWFKKKGYPVTWAPTLKDAQHELERLKSGTILLLENLRFSRGEKEHSEEFALELRRLGDYYVNDAWGALEHADTSLTLLPGLYDTKNKTIGLLVEHELKALEKLQHPKRPFVMCMGGAKLSEKLPAVEQALDHADTIILLPPLVFTFMKAQGIEVGASLVDESLIPIAQKILAKAADGKKLVMPCDFLISTQGPSGPYEIASSIKSGELGIALGPNSLKYCDEIIGTAATVFFNGPMGFFEYPETLIPLRKLLQSITQSNTFSVVGGGESVAAVKLFGLEKSINFCSTGGGTTLIYLLTGTLPGLRYLL